MCAAGERKHRYWGFQVIAVVVMGAVATVGCEPPRTLVSKQRKKAPEKNTSSGDSRGDSAPSKKQSDAASQEQGDAAEASSSAGEVSRHDSDAGSSAASSGAPSLGGQSNDGFAKGAANPKAGSPRKAAKEAAALFAVAKEEKERGKSAEAYQTAVRAWELASEFPEDQECSELLGKLEPFIDQQAAAANRSSGAAGGSRQTGKKLIVQ